MRTLHAVRFTIIAGAALAVSVAAGTRGAWWLQRAFGIGGWPEHFLLLPAAAVLALAHRHLRRRVPADRPQVRVALLAASMATALVALAAAASRGTFWWRDALRLSATSALALVLLLVLGWCAAVAVSEGRVHAEEEHEADATASAASRASRERAV